MADEMKLSRHNVLFSLSQMVLWATLSFRRV